MGTGYFSKKIILIPVHQDYHWTLCAVYNVGNVKVYGRRLIGIKSMYNLNKYVYVTSINMFTHSTIESCSPKGK